MAKANDNMAKTSKKSGDFTYIIIYLLEWLTGIIFYIISGSDKRKKLHSMQAILLGIVAIIIAFIPFIGILTWLVWLYGLYVGYEASVGVDVNIPGITGFAKGYAK